MRKVVPLLAVLLAVWLAAIPAAGASETVVPVNGEQTGTDAGETSQVEAVLFEGFPAGEPDLTVTRAQFVLGLWNLSGRPAPSTDTQFTDLSAQTWEAREAVAWAQEEGLVSGTAPGVFSPDAPVTRQAAMKILFAHSGGNGGMALFLSGIYDDYFEDSGQISQWARTAAYWGIYEVIIAETEPHRLKPGQPLSRRGLSAMMTKYADVFLQNQGGVVQ